MNQIFRRHKDSSQKVTRGKVTHLQPCDHWRVLRTTPKQTPRPPYNWAWNGWWIGWWTVQLCRHVEQQVRQDVRSVSISFCQVKKYKVQAISMLLWLTRFLVTWKLVLQLVQVNYNTSPNSKPVTFNELLWGTVTNSYNHSQAEQRWTYRMLFLVSRWKVEH